MEPPPPNMSLEDFWGERPCNSGFCCHVLLLLLFGGTALVLGIRFGRVVPRGSTGNAPPAPRPDARETELLAGGHLDRPLRAPPRGPAGQPPPPAAPEPPAYTAAPPPAHEAQPPPSAAQVAATGPAQPDEPMPEAPDGLRARAAAAAATNIDPPIVVAARGRPLSEEQLRLLRTTRCGFGKYRANFYYQACLDKPYISWCQRFYRDVRASKQAPYHRDLDAFLDVLADFQIIHG